ncbi:oligo-1,6-glucosidase [Enterococcus faecium E1679]|nr:oligo-1,6-glucosidase [Enterococcus faecium E1679]
MFGYIREYKNELLVVICSFSKESVPYELPKSLQGRKGVLLLSNYEQSPSELEDKFILRPYEALVYHI